MSKLVFGMCHYGPLPGDPHYNKQSLDGIAEAMLRDVRALQEGGVVFQ